MDAPLTTSSPSAASPSTASRRLASCTRSADAATAWPTASFDVGSWAQTAWNPNKPWWCDAAVALMHSHPPPPPDPATIHKNRTKEPKLRRTPLVHLFLTSDVCYPSAASTGRIVLRKESEVQSRHAVCALTCPPLTCCLLLFPFSLS